MIRLRKRHGLYADIRDEIDDLLENQPKAPGDIPGRADMETKGQEAAASARAVETVRAETLGETRPPPSTRPSTVDDPAPRASERIMCAFFGAVIGFALGVASGSFLFGGGLFAAITMTIGGAVAGAISVKRLRAISAALGGGVLGGIAFFMLASMVGDHWMWVAYGVSMGMVIGALAGILIGKKRSAG
jgi:hypothetical protein